MSLHTHIGERLIDAFGDRLADFPALNHDAINVRFDTGLTLQIRYASLDDYSLRWSYQEQVLGIDTAPLHPDLATFPNHLHSADGRLLADRMTRPGVDAWDNLQPLIMRLLSDPLLENAAQG